MISLIIKLILILYIIISPIISYSPIQNYTKYNTFIYLFIILSLIVCITYDATIGLLMMVILLTLVFKRSNYNHLF